MDSLRTAVERARRRGDLCFAALLPEERIRKAFGLAREVWQGWVYSPATTVWTFLSQCLSADHSCRDAVTRLATWLVLQGRKGCSAETGAYCCARDRIPEEACRALLEDTGRQVEDETPPCWLWHGRRVRVVDGTTATMPDTPENQKEYPQSPEQKPGCGFPMVRIVVVFSLTVGTVLKAALARCEGKLTGENSLFRTLHDSLAADDVVVGDRCFSGWFDLALLRQRAVDLVVRKHSMRPTDFRRGRRLGREDHLVRWSKPGRPPWMSAAQYASLPDHLELRELRVHVTQSGFRSKNILVITSLLDPEEFSADELAKLYRRRWDAELHLRSIKIVLAMDHLRCLKPHRVRNEIFMHLTGYNLIRGVMAAAAQEANQLPWQVSFKGTMQTLNNLVPILPALRAQAWCDLLLSCVATHDVGNRPDRYEPRCKKRRPKKFPRLSKPRAEYRKEVAA